MPRSRRLLPLRARLRLVVTMAAGVIACRAGAQMIPDVAPPSEIVTQAVGEAWLTEDERAELRVRHGLWKDEDLASPKRAARVALDTWDLRNPALSNPSVPRAWRAEALLRRGELNEALGLLGDDSSAEAVAVRAEILHWLGRHDEALAAARSLDHLLDDSATENPDDVVAAARAAMVQSELEPRSVDDWQRVLDALGGARQALDRLHWPSLLAEGSLLAEKHHPEQAFPALMQALSLGPRASEVWYRLGLLAVDRFAFEDAMRAVRAMRRAHAAHPLAALLEARIALERRDPELAERVLTKLLAREPAMPEAIALRAATAAARYRFDETKEWLDRLEAIAPGNALGHATVGKYLADARQYDIAAEHLNEAIRRAPSWSAPRITLGLLETQTARDDLARAALDAATKLDPFDKRAQNSLVLLNELVSYKVFEGKHFIVRCKPGADEIVAATMPGALDAMHEIVAGRFQHEPAQRTIIDLMPDHATFAVRITGMPQIHTIAACTGPMIAIEVPKEGPRAQHFGLFDWLKVLRHEYTHTVTLSQTKNRIPHWLTEAAAVSMELTPRDWGTCQMLARELAQGTLFDLDSINWGFVRPVRPQDRPLAYAQGHWMVEYMNERFGSDALVRLLELYSTGVTESEAIPRTLGVSREQFYRAFLGWAKGQVRSWGLAPSPTMEEIVLAERSKSEELRNELLVATEAALVTNAERIAQTIGEPGDPKTDRVTGREWTSAQLTPFEVDDLTVGRWLAEYPEHPDVLEAALRRAMMRFGTAFDPKSPEPSLIELAHRYRKARPVDPYPHRMLAKVELASDDPTRAIPHLVELDVREENNNAYAIELAKLYRQAGDRTKARDSVERAVRMDPYDAALRELAAAIAIEAGEMSLARLHVLALIRLEPNQPRHEARLRKLDEILNASPGA